MKLQTQTLVALFRGAIAATLIAGTTYFIVSQPAAATPAFAMQTGKSCGECHQSPGGGGALTAFGEKFKANGNKVPN